MSELSTPQPPALPKVVTIISRVTAASVATLAILSFFLSYEALRSLAFETGAFPQQAWVFPIIVDGALIVFSLSTLRASICGESTLWSWIILVGVTVTSVVLNIAHAPAEFLPRLVASLPPLALFASFESLMRQVRAEVVRAYGNSLPVTPINGKSLKKPVVISERDRIDRRTKVFELQKQGLSQSAIGKQLGVSSATIRRDLNSLRLVA